MIFDRFRGVLPAVVGEGTHFLIPWVQKPVYFSVRSQPRRVPVITGSKGHVIIRTILCLSGDFGSVLTDLQNVDITLRILFRPQVGRLPWIFSNVGVDYDDRVLPSITTEVLKAVVVRSPVSWEWCCCMLFVFVSLSRPNLMLVSSSHSEKWSVVCGYRNSLVAVLMVQFLFTGVTEGE